jgi:DNA-binding transcriptional ArsR family regulator
MANTAEPDQVAEMLRALAEPLRADIMTHITNVDELPCTVLEQLLPIRKSTISYHMNILRKAGLVDVRREGIYFHYTARREILEKRLPGILPWLRSRALSKPSLGEPLPSTGTRASGASRRTTKGRAGPAAVPPPL